MSHPIDADDLFEAALSGLPPVGAVADHLADGCETCEAELLRSERWLAEMAASAEPIEPSPAVAERLAARVRQDPGTHESTPSSRGISWALAAALAALAFGAGYWASFQLDGQPQRALAEERQAQLSERDATLAELRLSLEETEERLEEQDEELASIELELDTLRSAVQTVSAEDVQVLILQAAEPDSRFGESRARVFWEWEDYTCVVRAEGLPAASAGQQYILWVTTEAGEKIRVGELHLEGRGLATLFGRLPKDGGQVISATITEEAESAGSEPEGPVRFTGVVEGA